MTRYTEPHLQTRASELAPDDDPRDGCGVLGCKLLYCEGQCAHSLRQQARAVRLESERLALLAARRATSALLARVSA